MKSKFNVKLIWIKVILGNNVNFLHNMISCRIQRKLKYNLWIENIVKGYLLNLDGIGNKCYTYG
jgi:hypothetical protein